MIIAAHTVQLLQNNAPGLVSNTPPAMDQLRELQHAYQKANPMKPAFYKSKQAFTLVELIVVSAILGVLAIMSIPVFTQYVNKTKSGRAIAEIRTIEKDITAYIIDHNALPPTLNAAGFTRPDPWERPYEYSINGSGPAPLEFFTTDPLNTDYDLYSKGPDGLSHETAAHATSADDIVRSNDGGYAGLRAGL